MMMKPLLFSLLCGLAQAHAAAPDCQRMGPSGSRIVTQQTLDAGDAVEKLVRQAGSSADLRAIRLRTLKHEFPRADVDVTTRRLLRAFCEVVFADASLDETVAAARMQAAEREMGGTADGPRVVARTNSRILNSGRPILLAMAGGDGAQAPHWLAETLAYENRPGEDEDFLRGAPSFINDSNKYFVIVGSADSEERAIRLMNRLKTKAPKYDFVVYMPYGANKTYGVMMASWVSQEVAQKALLAARAAVARDAYVWACRGTGESC